VATVTDYGGDHQTHLCYHAGLGIDPLLVYSTQTVVIYVCTAFFSMTEKYLKEPLLISQYVCDKYIPVKLIIMAVQSVHYNWSEHVGFTSPGSGIAGAVNNGVYTSRSSTTPVWPQSAQFTPDPGIFILHCHFLPAQRCGSMGLAVIKCLSMFVCLSFY